MANAGQQSSEGLEFDLVFSPLPSIDVTFGGLMMDSNYDSFIGSAAKMLVALSLKMFMMTLLQAPLHGTVRGNTDGYRDQTIFTRPTLIRIIPAENEAMCAAGTRKNYDTSTLVRVLVEGTLILFFWEIT